ncbi:hypothetical protein DCAR_0830426 [Daucus carota subsp. sativus]|uniref:Uncharacterized protein n=1 Tax=Daucus carota subsp. sativus TaxID=79200 RepID=A0AAF0XPV3_DAUCS|nr:hypothetical protein DCAR_0830426 [Daucus carota subsp. sativus]
MQCCVVFRVHKCSVIPVYDIKVHDRVHDTYKGELEGKDFAYDEGKSLFTVGALSRNKLEFTVVLQDMSSNNPYNFAFTYNCCYLQKQTELQSCTPTDGCPHGSDHKRMRCPYQSKTHKMEISYAAKITM